MRVLLIFLTLMIFGPISVYAQQCGDVNLSGDVNVGDIANCYAYIFGLDTMDNFDSANVDGLCIINVADVAYLGEYLFNSGPAPDCAETSWCDYSINGTEIVSIGAPPYSYNGGGDIFSIPIYITNTSRLHGISIGLNYPSNDIEITSIDTTGTIAPLGFGGVIDVIDSVENEVLLLWVGATNVGSLPYQQTFNQAQIFFDVEYCSKLKNSISCLQYGLDLFPSHILPRNLSG